MTHDRETRSRSTAPGFLAGLILAGALGAPTTHAGEAAVDLKALLERSFVAKGQAKLARLEQSPMQAACSAPDGTPPPAAVAETIRDEAKRGIVFPEDGAFLGDWNAGETIAQTGKGMQYSDDPTEPSGGNCYACHELKTGDLSQGTLGPSLLGYGKKRGTSEATLRHTWTRLWNPHAFDACSQMPRFGDAGILTEAQLKDVMALLFDPASPVNQ